MDSKYQISKYLSDNPKAEKYAEVEGDRLGFIFGANSLEVTPYKNKRGQVNFINKQTTKRASDSKVFDSESYIILSYVILHSIGHKAGIGHEGEGATNLMTDGPITQAIIQNALKGQNSSDCIYCLYDVFSTTNDPVFDEWIKFVTKRFGTNEATDNQ